MVRGDELSMTRDVEDAVATLDTEDSLSFVTDTGVNRAAVVMATLALPPPETTIKYPMRILLNYSRVKPLEIVHSNSI